MIMTIVLMYLLLQMNSYIFKRGCDDLTLLMPIDDWTRINSTISEGPFPSSTDCNITTA